MGHLIQIVGQQFGRLLVEARAVNDKEGKPQFTCLCACGRRVIVRGKQLRSGRTQSCGCFQSARTRQALTKHGMAYTSTYESWSSMLGRCNNPNDQSFRNYGERGISVCEEWKDFRNFLSDMGARPKGKTLDRKNVNGPYSPQNCRWATPLEQANNKRNTRLLTLNERTMSLADWARELGFTQQMLSQRILSGLTDYQALTKPKRTPQTITLNGKTMTPNAWAKLLGLPTVTVYWRIRKGWPAERVLSKVTPHD